VKMRKAITALIIVVGAFFLSGCSEKKSPTSEEGLREGDFEVIGWADSPGGSPYGVCWDGQYRWITTRGNSQKIWALPPDSETPVTSFYSPCGMPSGIAFHNGQLWVTNADYGYIYVLSRGDGSVQDIIMNPCPNCSGITWVNNKLYLCDWIAGCIYRYDADMNLEKTFYGVYSWRHFYGIGWDGSRLWVGDYTRGLAYCFDLDLNPIKYGGDAYISPDYHPTGWAWDGEHLINTDTSVNRIYKTNPPSPTGN
jgi:hypothetical protein